MKKIFSFKSFLIIALFFLLLFIYAKLGLNHWQVVEAVDRPVVASGWSESMAVDINSSNWEDDAHITGDGNTLFYSYYPGNLTKDIAIGKIKDDIDIYYSEKPFSKFKKHAVSEDIWSESGMMISDSDIYYVSNRNRSEFYHIYKNGQLLIDIKNKSEKDPHYCAVSGELYFSVDDIIYVYKNNKSKALSNPINDGSQNIEPFLTKDCQQMYFSSNRGNGVLKIFKSNRSTNDSWSQPELVISSKYGVGNPSLTDDGKFLFFTQVFQSIKGEMNSDIFYVEKIED